MMVGKIARARRWWSLEEDQILRKEVLAQIEKGVPSNWNRVAAKLPTRSNKDCRKRWSKISIDVKKGAWDDAEDQRLKEAVGHHGLCWTEVAQAVKTRHADQCAKRWQHMLDPNVAHDKWGLDDDELLFRAVKVYGRSWTKISEENFPKRSPIDLKNRYALTLRRQQSARRHTAEDEVVEGSFGGSVEAHDPQSERSKIRHAVSRKGYLTYVPRGDELLGNMSSATSITLESSGIGSSSIGIDQTWMHSRENADVATETTNAQGSALSWDSLMFDTPLSTLHPLDEILKLGATDFAQNDITALSSPEASIPDPTRTPFAFPNSLQNSPASSGSSTITLTIEDAQPNILTSILDTLYRGGARYKLDVQRGSRNCGELLGN